MTRLKVYEAGQVHWLYSRVIDEPTLEGVVAWSLFLIFWHFRLPYRNDQLLFLPKVKGKIEHSSGRYQRCHILFIYQVSLVIYPSSHQGPGVLLVKTRPLSRKPLRLKKVDPKNVASKLFLCHVFPKVRR